MATQVITLFAVEKVEHGTTAPHKYINVSFVSTYGRFFAAVLMGVTGFSKPKSQDVPVQAACMSQRVAD